MVEKTIYEIEKESVLGSGEIDSQYEIIKLLKQIELNTRK